MELEQRIKKIKKIKNQIEKLDIAYLADRNLFSKINELEKIFDDLITNCSFEDRQYIGDFFSRKIYVIGENRHWAMMVGQRFFSKKNALEYIKADKNPNNKVFCVTMKEVHIDSN
ncbi:hypothetical protein phiOC_p127 [Ochrobactrum phage vB_OspM_OC]|nr:hypothetical protein phiOC_p127 [Ochrobactrum phage vB_OspM_OC]